MPRIFGQWEGIADPVHLETPGPAAALYYFLGGRLWYTMPDGSDPDMPYEDLQPLLYAVTLVGPPAMPVHEQSTFDSRLPYVLFTWMGVAGGKKPLYVVLRPYLDSLDGYLTAVDSHGKPLYGDTTPKNFVVLRTALVSNSTDWQAV